MRMRSPKKNKGKELELNVDICIEDELPDDPEIAVPFIANLILFLIFNCRFDVI